MPSERTAGRVLKLARARVPPSVLAGLIILAGWQLLSMDQPAYRLPGPLDVLASLWVLTVGEGILWGALKLSLAAFVIGSLLSFAVGMPLGIVMGANRSLERGVGPYVNALYVAPVSALTPVFVYMFGIGLEPRIATVFTFCAPVIILTCYRGARETPRTFAEVAVVYGARPLQVFRSVIVPHAVPFVVTAARLGSARAIKGTVLAELVVSSTGLGELIDRFRHVFDAASLIATLIFLLLLGLALQVIVERIEIAVAPWRRRAV